MICLVCGKNYIAVGVHAKHKHGITADEYRETFNLKKSFPLVDEDLSAHLSKNKIAYLKMNPDEKEIAAARIAEAAARVDRSKVAMSDAAKDQLRQKNRDNNKKYLAENAGVISDLLKENTPLNDIYRVTGVSPAAIKKMAKQGMVSYDKAALLDVRRQRILTARAKARDEMVASVLALYDTDMSIAEICRRTGVGYTSYKRWVRSGLLPKRSTYMAP